MKVHYSYLSIVKNHMNTDLRLYLQLKFPTSVHCFLNKDSGVSLDFGFFFVTLQL